MYYSIIIPIFNEFQTLDQLLFKLRKYYDLGHEIIIINDGSIDNSFKILNKNQFIKLITLEKNHGKGFAIKKGLEISKNNKVLIYDGDLELKISQISKLMVLNKEKNILSVMGIRFKSLNPLSSASNWGNFIFTIFFNFLNFSSHKDILCCAKSFYKNDFPIKRLKSLSFDIDVEIAGFLSKINQGNGIKQVLLDYKRRSIKEGKKLKTSDGWIILKRIIINF